MADAMTTARLLEEMRVARAEWEALLAEVGEARMEQPGAAGEWSVKDVIAHISWGEREMLDVVRQRALAGSDLWNQPQTERNAAVYRENRDRALTEVLAESQRTAADLLAAVASLTDDALNDARYFREMPADWLPWQVFAGNTYEHYRDHIESIHGWLARA